MPAQKITSTTITFLFLLLALYSGYTYANGVLRNGIGSKAIGLAGSELVFADNGLAAMNSNPAALSDIKNTTLQLSATIASLDAEYNNAGTNVDADSSPGFIPEVAYTRQLSDQLTLGLALNPVSTLDADWIFLDPADGLGTTFGNTQHKSSFIVARASAGLGYKVNNRFSIGTSLGVLYNRNRLKAPYTFQSHPVLSALGAKASADLEADGFGVNAVISANYEATDNLTLSLSYTLSTDFDTTGDIKGTLPLGLGFYSYDAEVETELPQIIQAGFNWKARPDLRLGFQVDWVDWSNAFRNLPLHLTNGTNAALNTILGSTRLDDTAALNWQDSFVYRFAAEYDYSDKITLRAGYRYGDNPVPSTTVTPMSAAIMEHALALGAGFRSNNYSIDIAYQWDIPTDISIANSQLNGGAKYNNSNIDVSIHWFSISLSLDSL